MTALATLNNFDVIEATIQEPRTGVWHADLEIDGEEDITGAVTLTFAEGEASVSFVGTVFISEPFQGRTAMRIVGGAGGLPQQLAPKYYVGASIRTTLDDILTATGETLDAASDTAALAGFLPRWSRLGGQAANALQAILDKRGLSFRLTRAGEVLIATDTFPGLVTDTDEVVLDRIPEENRLLVAPEAVPRVLPGVTFDGVQVDRVTTRLRDNSLRQDVWGAGSVADRLKGSLSAFIKSVSGRQLDPGRLYPCTVVTQAADLTLSVKPDDTTVLPGSGLSSVPIRHGLPGFKVKVPRGARVRVGFDGGDPSRPFATLWDEGNVTEVAFDGGAEDVARTNDTTSSGTLAFDPLIPSLTYTPPGGPPTPVTPVGVPLTGFITSGNPKLKA